MASQRQYNKIDSAEMLIKVMIWLLQWQIFYITEKIISLNQVSNSYCVAVQSRWSAQMCTWHAKRQLSDQSNVVSTCETRSRTAISWKKSQLTDIYVTKKCLCGRLSHIWSEGTSLRRPYWQNKRCSLEEQLPQHTASRAGGSPTFCHKTRL